MKKLTIFIFILSFSLACSVVLNEHPSQLQIAKTNIEVTDYSIPYEKKRQTIAIEFTGKEPFTYIKSKSRRPQFRCYVLSDKKVVLSEITFGTAYRFNAQINDYEQIDDEGNIGPNAILPIIIVVNPETNQVEEVTKFDHVHPTPLPYSKDNNAYRVFVFSDLDAATVGNNTSNHDFDLLKDDYGFIKCHLVGVQMMSKFVYSNDLFFSKQEVLDAYQAYQNQIKNDTKYP